MALILFIIAYLSLFQNISPSQTVLDPLVYGSADGNFHILLEMGEPAQMVYLRIDMVQPASWITHNVYRPEHSYSGTKNGEASSLQIGYFSYDSLIKHETLKISRKNLNLKNFYFHYLDIDRPEGTYDSLSLAYSFNDIRMSLVHQLYESKALSKKQFSFVPLDSQVGYLYLGYLPQDKMEKENYRKVSSCKVNPNYNTWGCDIEKVFIDSNVYESNQYAYFNPTTKYTLVPHSFMSFFTETFMREYLDNNICTFDNIIDTYRCDCTQMTSIPKVVIMLGGEKIELNEDVLFTSYKPQCDLKFKTNVMNMNWVFGSLFINDHIVNFNYAKQMIDIYSNRTSFPANTDVYYFVRKGKEIGILKILFWSAAVVLISVLLVFVYIKVRRTLANKKNKKKKKKSHNQSSFIESVQ